jgi:hypothetical protein
MRSARRIAAVAVVLAAVSFPARAGVAATRVDGFSATFRSGKVTGSVSAARVTTAGATPGVPTPAVEQDVVMVCVIAYQEMTYVYPGGSIKFPQLVEYGCGKISFALEDDLTQGTAKGRIRSFYTGGKISLTVTVKQRGDLVPFAGANQGTENSLSGDQTIGELLEQHGFGGASIGLRRAGRADIVVRAPMVTTKALGGPATMFRYVSAGADV